MAITNSFKAVLLCVAVCSASEYSAKQCESGHCESEEVSSLLNVKIAVTKQTKAQKDIFQDFKKWMHEQVVHAVKELQKAVKKVGCTAGGAGSNAEELLDYIFAKCGRTHGNMVKLAMFCQHYDYGDKTSQYKDVLTACQIKACAQNLVKMGSGGTWQWWAAKASGRSNVGALIGQEQTAGLYKGSVSKTGQCPDWDPADPFVTMNWYCTVCGPPGGGLPPPDAKATDFFYWPMKGYCKFPSGVQGGLGTRENLPQPVVESCAKICLDITSPEKCQGFAVAPGAHQSCHLFKALPGEADGSDWWKCYRMRPA